MRIALPPLVDLFARAIAGVVVVRRVRHVAVRARLDRATAPRRARARSTAVPRRRVDRLAGPCRRPTRPACRSPLRAATGSSPTTPAAAAPTACTGCSRRRTRRPAWIDAKFIASWTSPFCAPPSPKAIQTTADEPSRRLAYATPDRVRDDVGLRALLGDDAPLRRAPVGVRLAAAGARIGGASEVVGHHFARLESPGQAGGQVAVVRRQEVLLAGRPPGRRRRRWPRGRPTTRRSGPCPGGAASTSCRRCVAR